MSFFCMTVFPTCTHQIHSVRNISWDLLNILLRVCSTWEIYLISRGKYSMYSTRYFQHLWPEMTVTAQLSLLGWEWAINFSLTLFNCLSRRETMGKPISTCWQRNTSNQVSKLVMKISSQVFTPCNQSCYVKHWILLNSFSQLKTKHMCHKELTFSVQLLETGKKTHKHLFFSDGCDVCQPGWCVQLYSLHLCQEEESGRCEKHNQSFIRYEHEHSSVNQSGIKSWNWKERLSHSSHTVWSKVRLAALLWNSWQRSSNRLLSLHQQIYCHPEFSPDQILIKNTLQPKNSKRKCVFCNFQEQSFCFCSNQKCFWSLNRAEGHVRITMSCVAKSPLEKQFHWTFQNTQWLP